MPDNRKEPASTPGGWRAPALLPLSEPGGDYPLSFQQNRLWFLQQLNTDDFSYNESAVYLMRGRLDRARLQRAVDCLIERWHILRTIYPSPNGAPMQHILTRARVIINYAQPIGYTESGRMSEAMATIRRQISRPFDLASDLPLRIQVYELEGNNHLLLIVTHHIATDGWSWPILLRDLFDSYANGLHQDVVNHLPPPALQYADYAIWQQTNQTDNALQPALSFWKRRLDGQAVLSLFPDRPRPPARAYRGAGVTLSLPSDLIDRCKRFAREQRVTLFVVLLGVFKVLLARRSGQSDIVVGVPVANRTSRKLEPMIGFFVNTVTVRTELSNVSSFAELLKTVQTDWLESLEYQDTPFEKLVAAMRTQRDLSRNPIFQVMFALDTIPPFRAALDELELERVPIEPAASKFDLEFSLSETGQGIEGVLTYDTDLFDASTIEQMAAQYTSLLEAAISDPDASILGTTTNSPSELLRVTEERIVASTRRAEPSGAPLAPSGLLDDSDELLRRLLEVWRDVLCIETIGLDTDFFEIGGHSLSAAGLIMRIKRTFGIRLPVSAVFEAPTVRLLGARMRGGEGPTTAFLLGPAQTDWATQPLFCLHGLFLFRSLAEELGENIPTYGIYVDEEIYGLNERARAGGLLNYLVTHYISKIKAVRPNGPYHLAGLSRGGLIAIETARQLALAGDAIGLVALFDTNAPGAVRQSRLAGLRHLWRSHADRLNFWRSGTRDNRELREAAVNDETIFKQLYGEAFDLHQTKLYKGDVVVFQADTSNWGKRPDDLGWRRYVRGDVTVHAVPGDHTGILKPPNVVKLSAKLKPYLSR